MSLQSSQAKSSILAGGNYGDENGQGEGARFGSIRGMALDLGGNLLVADAAAATIRKVSMDGTVSTFAGTGRSGRLDGGALESTFSSPNDVALDAQGVVYVADTGNDRLRKIMTDGQSFTLTRTRGWYQNPDEGLQYDFPGIHSVAARGDGTVYVTDDSKNVYQVDPSGHISIFTDTDVHTFGGDWATRYYIHPGSLKLNSEGRLYMALNGLFYNSYGIWFWHSHNAIEQLLSGKDTNSFLDGPTTFATTGRISGIDFDAEGNLYFCDSSNQAIREVTKSGDVRTLLGDGKTGNILGIPTEARLNGLEDLVVGKDGNLYVAESGNYRILRITLH